MKAKRMVVKIGSSSLTDDQGLVSEKKMNELVSQTSALLKEHHVEIILVSSGAVASGLGHLGWSRSHITMPEKQAAAAVGQGILIERYQKLFANHGIQIAQLL